MFRYAALRRVHRRNWIVRADAGDDGTRQARLRCHCLEARVGQPSL